MTLSDEARSNINRAVCKITEAADAIEDARMDICAVNPDAAYELTVARDTIENTKDNLESKLEEG